MEKIESLNIIANEYLMLSEGNRVLFKAIIEAENIGSLEDMQSVFERLQKYEFCAEDENADEFFRRYLAYHAPTDFDTKWLEEVSSHDDAQKLLKALGAKATNYGIVSACGRSLYENVAFPTVSEENVDKEKYELIEVCGQKALFSNGRISDSEVPDLNGYGFKAIASILNEEGVKSPAYYQKILLNKDLGYNKPNIAFKYLWDNTGVKRILQNDFYIGTLTCHKTYNNKITHVRRNVPKDEQIVHEDFAPAIISKDIFAMVQKMIDSKKRGNVRAGTSNPCHRYAGLLKCGECGSTFVCKIREWRDQPTRIEYVCNGYHRYGKENCTSHKINETDLDRIVYGEIMHIREQAQTIYKKIDSDIHRWMKNKGVAVGKLDKLQRELDKRKKDQKEILLERLSDREHADVYEEMLEICDNDIKRIAQEILDIRNYSDTIKKRKANLKQAIDIIDEVVKEGAISDANLRMLIDRIVIYELAEGLNIEIEVNANFKNHRNFYDENGDLITESNDSGVSVNFIERSRGRKPIQGSRP